MPRPSESDVLFDIGRRIAELRGAAGMSLQQLSDAIGVSPQRLREMESGSHNPSVKTLYRIASGLGVELIEVFRSPSSRERAGPGRPKRQTAPAPKGPASRRKDR